MAGFLGLRQKAAAFLRCRRGVAAIEFAFAAPVLILMAAGVYEFSAAYQDQIAVNRLASQFAGAWADCSDTPAGTCSTELNQYIPLSNPAYILANVAPQLTTSGSNVYSVRMIWVKMTGSAGNLTPSLVYSRQVAVASVGAAPVVNTSAGMNAAEQTLAQQTFTVSGQQGVIVTVTYLHTATIFPNSFSVLSANGGISFTNAVPQLTNN